MLSLLLFITVITALIKGAVNIPLEEILSGKNQTILHMRLLRVAVAILAGCGLATAGIVLQAILRNPLAEPYLLGTSSGAGLASVTAVILGISRLFLPLAAFIGAIASIAIVYAIGRERGKVSDKSLILAGVIISVAFSSIIVFLVSLFGDKTMHEINWWLWGSFQVYDVKLVGLAAIPIIAGVLIIYLYSQDLNAISLGEEEAMHLGIDVQKVKKTLILISALITASLICICGIIGFVGLIVPHIMRKVCGPNHKILIPLTCFAASAFMVACDLISRTAFSPIEIPIGVITALIGTPVFIILLKQPRRIL